MTSGAGTSQLWCEQAWLGGPSAEAGVLLEIDGDRIASVRTGVPAPVAGAEVLDGLTLPGIANAHSHCFHRALRGRTQAGEGSFWTWRQQMYAAAAVLDPASYHQLAVGVFGEMVMAGYTSVGEFHYLHHQPDGSPYAPAHQMELALIDAAAEAGIRMTLLDTCYLHGGIGKQLEPVQRRFSDGSAQRWADRVTALAGSEALAGRAAVRVGAAVHSVRAVAPHEVAVVARWAAAHGAPLHAHVSEQPAENTDCLRAYGLSPTAVLAADGALTVPGGFCAVHATHLSADDLRAYGQVGAFVCFCPTTERDLADGIGPSTALRQAGARLCVGSDSHAVLDAFEELRAVELNERLASGARGTHSAEQLLTAGAVHGNAAIGWPDAGRLQAGALADLVTVRTDSIRLAGTDPAHVLEAVLFAASPADIDAVMVGGRWMARLGFHLSVPDVARHLDHAIKHLATPPGTVAV